MTDTPPSPPRASRSEITRIVMKAHPELIEAMTERNGAGPSRAEKHQG